jgi:xylan 1,4-beta-xylosidase
LSERPGFLRLKGKSSLGNWFAQALVARRQEAFCFSAETKVEFDPLNFQQRAGLVCYYNAHKYHYLYISVDEQGRRYIDIASCLGDASGKATYLLSESRGDSAGDDIGIDLPRHGPVWLRCDVAYAKLTFSFSVDGRDWQTVPVECDYSLISDEAGKGEGASFTGAFVGMCCQDISGTDLPADFDYFYYKETE